MLSASHGDCEVRVRRGPDGTDEMTSAFTLSASYLHTSLSSYITTSMNVLQPFSSTSNAPQRELYMHNILSDSSGSRCEWW